MPIKYYIKNLPKGFIMLLAYTYYWYSAADNLKLNWMLLYFIIGCFLFPLSKFTIERAALKYTTRKFWTTGFFVDDIGKSGLVAIYWLVVFLFFPISLVIFAFNLSSKAM